MSRPRSTARTSVAKLSSVSTIFAACLDTSEPLPMATPMSACLRAAASLTASPVIATTSPDCCMSSRQPELVLGRHPAEDVQLGKPLDDLLVGQVLQFGAGDHAGAEAELVGDGASGHGVVAGDHPHVDPGAERDADRVLGLGAERVHDPDQRHEDEIGDRGHRVGERRGHRRVVQVPGGEREHPQPAFGQLAVGGQDLVAHGGDRAPARRATARGCSARGRRRARPSRW